MAWVSFFLSQRKDVSHCSRTPWCHFAASHWETFCVWGATLNSFYWGIHRKGARPLGPPNTVFSSTPKPHKTALDHAFPLGGRQNAWGTHVLLQFQAAVAIFLGVWRDSHEKYAVYSWVWMFEMEVCCGWWIDKSRSRPRYLEAPWPTVPSRSQDQQDPKFHRLSSNFPRNYPDFPRIFPDFFRSFSSSDPPGPPNSLSAVRTRESTWERPLALGGPMAPWHPRDIPSETWEQLVPPETEIWDFVEFYDRWLMCEWW